MLRTQKIIVSCIKVWLLFNFFPQPAYYEISAGGHYYVFSAGRRTGDHRLVESGNGTRPTDLLKNRALIQGERCAKYFRITGMSGLYTCENSQNLLVASTYDFVSDSPVSTCVCLYVSSPTMRAQFPP